MKHLTISLLTVFLCLSLLMCCDGNTSVDSGVSKKDRVHKTTNLSEEEKKARMKAAQNGYKKEASQTETETNPLVDAKTNSASQKIGSDQAEQSSRDMRRRYEEVMKMPPDEKQKKVADDICKCLNKNPLFKTLKNAKTDKEVLKIAGKDKDKEVKALQNCYNNHMVPAVNNLGQDAGIFAMKSRTHLNKNCLDGSDKFWIGIGGYLSRNSEKATIEIDMPKMEKGQQ